MSSEGVAVVLSPVQLAALLENDNVSEPATFTNRMWGAARTVGATVELLGAGVLCLLPEPTMASKAGCVVLGVHGADGLGAGVRQMASGRDEATLTQRGVSAAARALGADPAMAENVGLAVDIAVPLAFAGALGAARVASVRAGRIKLAMHEAQFAGGPGGHTLFEHVGRTQAQLQARLASRAGRHLRHVSTFRSLRLAEEAVSKCVRANSVAIRDWAQLAAPGAKQPFTCEVGRVVGHVLVRSSGKLMPATKVRVVLKMERYNGMPYYVLTAFPIL